jgi:hypothetical protein
LNVYKFHNLSSALILKDHARWEIDLSEKTSESNLFKVDLYLNIHSLQKNGLFGGILSYFPKVLENISGYFADSNGRQKINSGFFAFAHVQ